MDNRNVEEMLADHVKDRGNSEMFENVSKEDKIRAFDAVVQFLNSEVAAKQRQEKIDSHPDPSNYYLAAERLAEQLSNEGFSPDNFNLLFDSLCGGIFEDPHHGIFRLVCSSNFQWNSFNWDEWEERM